VAEGETPAAKPPGPGFLGDRFSAWLGLFSAAVLLVSVVWAIDRGFDLTDEGYYLLGYQPYQPLGMTLSNFHLIVRTILGFLTIDILGARLLRLALTLAGLFLFSRSLASFAIEYGLRHYKPRVAFGVLAVGMFYGYSFGPQSLSYNHLTQFLALVYCCLAMGLLSTRSSPLKRCLHVAAFGPVLILLIQIKFTSGLAFLTFGVLLIWVSFRDQRRSFFVALGIYLAALLIAAAAYFLLIQSPDEVLAMFRSAGRYSMRRHSHGWRQLSIDLARFLATSLGLLCLLVAVQTTPASLVRAASSRAAFRMLPLLAGVGLLWAGKSFTEILSSAHALFVPALSALASILVSMQETGRLKAREVMRLVRRFDRSVVLTLLLYVSPIFVAFGSNNGVRTNAVFGAAFTYGMWLLLQSRNRGAGQDILLILVLSYSVWGVERNLILSPYRQAPLLQQTERLDFLAQNQTIRVDPETHAFLRASSLLVRSENQARTTVLALYRLPGLVYLLGDVSSGGFAWSETTNDLIVDEIARSGLIPQVVISAGEQVNPDLDQRLGSLGLDLEGNYRLIGRLSYRAQRYSFFSRR